MNRVLLSLIALSVFAFAKQANAQHTDVQFSYVDGRIKVLPEVGGEDLIFDSFFPTFGIEAQFATLPGFISEAIGGLGIEANDEIFYDVLDDLQYWNGSEVTAPPENVNIRVNNVGAGVPDTNINGSSGEQLGGEDLDGDFPVLNRIGAADGAGDFHTDLQWFLEPAGISDFGAYAVTLRLRTDAEGIEVSDPFIFAFNFGLNSTELDEALNAFGELLDPGLPGDFDADGDVDGSDFLLWQQGDPSDPPSPDDLSDWLANFGAPNQPPELSSISAIPEPNTVVLAMLGFALLARSKRRLDRSYQ